MNMNVLPGAGKMEWGRGASHLFVELGYGRREAINSGEVLWEIVSRSSWDSSENSSRKIRGQTLGRLDAGDKGN